MCHSRHLIIKFIRIQWPIEMLVWEETKQEEEEEQKKNTSLKLGFQWFLWIKKCAYTVLFEASSLFILSNSVYVYVPKYVYACIKVQWTKQVASNESKSELLSEWDIDRMRECIEKLDDADADYDDRIHTVFIHQNESMCVCVSLYICSVKIVEKCYKMCVRVPAHKTIECDKMNGECIQYINVCITSHHIT